MSNFGRNLVNKIRVKYNLPMFYQLKFKENGDFDFGDYKKDEPKFPNFLIDVVEMIDDFCDGFYDAITLHKIRYTIRNIRSKSHCLEVPGAKLGVWSDLSWRIPEAMFHSVVKFIEGECAYMNNMGDKKAHKKIDADEVYAASQGIAWIKFQASPEFCSQEQDNNRLAIIEIYRYAKYIRPSNAEKLAARPTGKFDYDEYRKLEREIEDLDTYYLKMIVQYRDYLWT